MFEVAGLLASHFPPSPGTVKLDTVYFKSIFSFGSPKTYT